MPRLDWPPYQTVHGLVHAQLGRPAVIMGGGESLPAAMPYCPADAIYISVNDHGVRLLKDRPELARRCEYIVACDKIEPRARADVRQGAAALPWGLPVISRQMWADYRLLEMPAPSSGMTAAWFARFLGCTPIILTGMDLYVGGTYFDDPAAKSTGRVVSDRDHFQRWCRLFKAYPAQYRTIGCSPLLQDRIGLYSAPEVLEPPAKRETLRLELTGIWIRITQDVMISQRWFQSGQRVELMRGEADKVVREKKGVRLKSGEIPQ